MQDAFGVRGRRLRAHSSPILHRSKIGCEDDDGADGDDGGGENNSFSLPNI